MLPEKTNEPFADRLRELPESSSSTSPGPSRPVTVPPTVYLSSMLQPKIASAAAAMDIHANVFTRESPKFDHAGHFRPWSLEIIPGRAGFFCVKKCVAAPHSRSWCRPGGHVVEIRHTSCDTFRRMGEPNGVILLEDLGRTTSCLQRD